MKLIKVTTTFPEWPLEQQTPGRCAVWGNYRFVLNAQVEECDYWIVFDGLPSAAETCLCPAGGTVLITAEPPSVRAYNRAFVSQFSCVVSAHRDLVASRLVISPPALPWHLGRRVSDSGQNLGFNRDYDVLCSCPVPAKKALLSVIASEKIFTPEHEYRLKFVDLLRSEFGPDIDIFGRGIRNIEDKWDAIAPYRYHVVLENASVADYWTEKIVDTYLSWSYPLYMGCPNLATYFPAESFLQLEWGQSELAIATIKETLERDPYERSLEYIRAARRKCLDEYNFFPFIARMCDSLPTGRRRRVTIKPEGDFVRDMPRKESPFTRWMRRR